MRQTTPNNPTFEIDPVLREMQDTVHDEHRHLTCNFLIIHFCAVVCFRRGDAVTFCAQACIARTNILQRATPGVSRKRKDRSAKVWKLVVEKDAACISEAQPRPRCSLPTSCAAAPAAPTGRRSKSATTPCSPD